MIRGRPIYHKKIDRIVKLWRASRSGADVARQVGCTRQWVSYVLIREKAKKRNLKYRRQRAQAE